MRDDLKTDQFMKCYQIVKKWFEDEELEVSDLVLGRMASRLHSSWSDREKELIEKAKSLIAERADVAGCMDDVDVYGILDSLKEEK